MAQADQSVENALFPAVRAEINNNFAALFSNNSGTSAPAVTVPHMDWVQDTGAGTAIWYRRNAADNGWLTIATISGSTILLEGALPAQASQNGKFLTTNGTVPSWAPLPAGGRLLRAPRTLTGGTSYATPADCNAIYVEAVGGGGGGSARDGGPAAGGGSGAYCAKYFTVAPFTSYAYAIGAGGAGTFVNSNGPAGGATTFTVGGTTISAGGGGGGLISGGLTPYGVGGAGGSAVNGDTNAAGTIGIDSGNGGSSFFGGGGALSRVGAGGAGSVGGGGGATTDFNVGGPGGNGLIRIWEYS